MKNLYQMTNIELKQYISKHRNDDDAFHAAMEVVMSRRNPERRHPYPLGIKNYETEVEAIFREKLAISISEGKQTISEAVDQIKELIRQLEETNPYATEREQVYYVENNVHKSLKERTIAAIKAGGETAIEEFFREEKDLKVFKAVVKSWLQPSS